jgi:hypothetical protein
MSCSFLEVRTWPLTCVFGGTEGTRTPDPLYLWHESRVFDSPRTLSFQQSLTGLTGFLPTSWDHLGCQSWDHPARLVGGSASMRGARDPLHTAQVHAPVLELAVAWATDKALALTAHGYRASIKVSCLRQPTWGPVTGSPRRGRSRHHGLRLVVSGRHCSVRRVRRGCRELRAGVDCWPGQRPLR